MQVSPSPAGSGCSRPLQTANSPAASAVFPISLTHRVPHVISVLYRKRFLLPLTSLILLNAPRTPFPCFCIARKDRGWYTSFKYLYSLKRPGRGVSVPHSSLPSRPRGFVRSLWEWSGRVKTRLGRAAQLTQAPRRGTSSG